LHLKEWTWSDTSHGGLVVSEDSAVFLVYCRDAWCEPLWAWMDLSCSWVIVVEVGEA
jgi:hypothetical protein